MKNTSSKSYFRAKGESVSGIRWVPSLEAAFLRYCGVLSSHYPKQFVWFLEGFRVNDPNVTTESIEQARRWARHVETSKGKSK